MLDLLFVILFIFKSDQTEFVDAFQVTTSLPVQQTCRTPRPPKNGSVSVWGDNLIVEYMCDEGLFPVGSSFGSCDTTTGLWSVHRPLCVSSKCDPPDEVRNGNIYFSNGGGIAIVHCDLGYRLLGSAKRHCDGYTWRGFRPRCREIYYSSKERRQERDNVTMSTTTSKPIGTVLEEDILDADNTCYHDFSNPPEIEHATVDIVYKFNTKRKQWILIAKYVCEDGSSYSDMSATYLYCKEYKWIGKKLPECTYVLEPEDPCKNNNGGCSQICVPHTGGRYDCDCEPGFYLGRYLKRCYDVNECLMDNGGCEHTCINTEGSFFCTCVEGYIPSGNRCLDEDECSLSDRHSCTGECINIPGSYRCNCSEKGVTESNDGRSCVDVDECNEDNGGCEDKCVNTHGTYRCSCHSKGYQLSKDGHTCEDLDECGRYKNKCKHGICENTRGSYICNCFEGYEALHSRLSCTDIDECKQNTSVCEEICTNNIGSFSCGCGSDGFSIATDGRTCIDRNECETNNGGCEDICVNTKGSFHCACQKQYHALSTDGSSCTTCNRTSYFKEGNCHSCPHNTIVAENVSTAFDISDCICIDGFRLEKKSFRKCIDIDECIEDILVCDHMCVNVPGSAYCTCDTGFILTGDVSCTDIDECTNSSCFQICENTFGSYYCRCHEGYSLNPDTNSCYDIDECADDILNCEHDCINTEGSAHCVCNTGFRLDKDGRSCEDEDECSLGTHVCDDLCINTVGSYICDCSAEGLKLSWDLASCADINECMEGKNSCEGDCVNTYGSYTCGCPGKGYKTSLTGTTCEDIDECSSPTLNHCKDTCINTLGSYICDCRLGAALIGYNKCAPCPKDYYRDENSVECTPCPEHAETHGVGSKRRADCFCISGYYGDLGVDEVCVKRTYSVVGRKENVV